MKINVKHIAKLANLYINEGEIEKFEKQLSEVLLYVDQLQKIDTTNIQPTSQVTGMENVLREDVALTSLSQEDALANGKNIHNGLFKVQGVLENG